MPDTQTIVFLKSFEFTDAQIKSLPSTPIELIPAPGIGKAIIPLHCVKALSLPSEDFYQVGGLASVEGDRIVIEFGSGIEVADIVNTATQSGFSIFINNNQVWFPPISINGVFDSDWNGFVARSGLTFDQIENQNLRCSMYTVNGNLTGGNAANKLKITIAYNIIDL